MKKVIQYSYNNHNGTATVQYADIKKYIMYYDLDAHKMAIQQILEPTAEELDKISELLDTVTFGDTACFQASFKSNLTSDTFQFIEMQVMSEIYKGDYENNMFEYIGPAIPEVLDAILPY